MSSADSYVSLHDYLLDSQPKQTTSVGIDMVWIDISSRIQISEPEVLVALCYLTTYGDRNSALITGDSRLLAVGVAMGTIPAGVLWDRLTEYPEEIANCPHPELIPQIIDTLRAQYKQ